MNTNDTKNPWLGLRSYPEGKKIYGRDSEIEELSQKILYNTQTVIYGRSGIGKSSILKAGVFPILRKSDYFPVYIRLVHDDKQEGYVEQIKAAVKTSLTKLRVEDLGAQEGDIIQIIEGYVEEVVPRYNTSHPEGLWEFFHRHKFYYKTSETAEPQQISPVLVFDQFEEIFHTQKEQSKVEEFFKELAALLNNICPEYLLQSTVDVEEVNPAISSSSLIKIGLVRKNERKDYIDETNLRLVISLREDYLSYLERNITHIPSLKNNRYCLLPLCEDKAVDIIMKPAPGLIDLNVAENIICKVTGAKLGSFTIDDTPELEVNPAILSLYLSELYKKKASEEEHITNSVVEQVGTNIISDFYTETISKISRPSIDFLEKRLVTKEGRRDSIYVEQALRHGVTREEINYLVKQRLLHEYTWRDGRRIEYTHDVLCTIVSERVEKREKEKQRERIKLLKRKNRITISIVILLISLIVAYYFAYHHPVTHRYATTKKVFGQFKGVESISEKQASYLDYHFVFKKKGLLTSFYSSMECRNRFDSLSTNHSMQPYLMAGSYEDSLLVDGISLKVKEACKWEFLQDPVTKKIAQERAYNKNNELIYAFNYNQPNKPKKPKENYGIVKSIYGDLDNTIIGSYVDGQGLPLQILKDGYRFVRISYNKNGHDMLVEYFDEEGNPATNTDGAYQIYYEYNDDGLALSMSSLNIYGKRMIDKAGNCGQICEYDGYKRVKITSVDEFGREKAVNSGYSRVLWKYDEHGRATEASYWDKETPIMDKESNIHKVEFKYNDSENSLTRIFYDDKEEETQRLEVRLDERGNCLYYFNDDGTTVTSRNSRFDKDSKVILQNEITITKGDTTGVFNYEKVDTVETYKFEGSMYNNYINHKTYDSQERLIEDVYYTLDGKTPYEKITHSYTDNGRDKESLYRIETDSTVYHYINELAGIVVTKSSINQGRVVQITYNSDTIITVNSNQIIDLYNNRIEEQRGIEKGYYLTNAKTNELIGVGIGLLTKYKFPYTSNSPFYYYDLSKSVQIPCDENGNPNVEEGYTLPEIYTGIRDKRAVFIEYPENGRMWHGVLLASDSGIQYGDENYSAPNFGQHDEVLCLNLTTMRIVTLTLDKLGWWSMLDYNITQTEYDIYKEHYDNCDIKKGKFEKQRTSIVLGIIEDKEGWLAKQGYSGSYIVLEWCDWDCTQTIGDFTVEFEKKRKYPKSITLLPVENIEAIGLSKDKTDKKAVFKDIIHLECPEDLLGMRLMDFWTNMSDYQEQILEPYNNWKK